MPNEAAFFMDDRDTAELPEFSEEPCMTDCAESIEITMRAAVLDVTPEAEEDEAVEEAAVTEEEAPGTACRARPRTGRRRRGGVPCLRGLPRDRRGCAQPRRALR
jgi:hypothetical protein